MSKTTKIDAKMVFVCKLHLKTSIVADLGNGAFVTPIKRPDVFGAIECYKCKEDGKQRFADFVLVKVKES